MSKRYDAATKRLLEMRPEDWVKLIGLPQGPVSLVDADLSTVSAYADRLVRVEARFPYLMHNELESGESTADIPFRLFQHLTHSAFRRV